MSRFTAFAAYLAGTTALVAAAMLACGSTDDGLDANVVSPDSGQSIPRDSSLVDPPTDGGLPLDAGMGLQPNCQNYCDLVTANCLDGNAQYTSSAECTAFCAHLPLSQAGRSPYERDAPSVACRQYWADSPAKTNPDGYCLAAGPFGGSSCGDRCTAFCDVVLSACRPESGNAPYPDRASCATACAAFSYRDGGLDGGGESPEGPESGNSLNCRLYHLRAAVQNPDLCRLLKPESSPCKD